MIANTKSSLDALKRQALLAIINNINISFPDIRNDILKMISIGDGKFQSLLERHTFDYNIVSSSQTNASWLLSYLDFYSLYAILLANSNGFDSMRAASTNKFMYINSMYKDLDSTLKHKQSLKTNKDGMFISFLNPKHIDIKNSGINSRYNKIVPVLTFKDALTLPVESSIRVKPQSIICSDDDQSVHTTLNSLSAQEISYSILRNQQDKIGVVSAIISGKSAAYSLPPSISGTMNGYFAERLYIIYKLDDTLGHAMQASTDNENWSDLMPIQLGTQASIYTEDMIDTGLKIILLANEGLKDGDSWSAIIKYVSLAKPTLSSKIKFGILEQISYITLSDVSRYELDFSLTPKMKKRKYSDVINVEGWHRSFIGSIIPVHSQADELIIKTKQPNAFSDSYDGKPVYNYEFKINNIEAVCNQYKPYGSITFDKINCDSIYNIALDAREHQLDFTFIEHAIIASNEKDTLHIPIINMLSDYSQIEFIIPDSTDGNGTAIFKLRFPHTIQAIHAYDMDLTEYNVTVIEGAAVQMEGYNRNKSYYVSYEMTLNTESDALSNELSSKWIQTDSIAYMYYVDSDFKIQLAIRQIKAGYLEAFTGTITPYCEMRSLLPAYTSPMVTEYRLLIN